jgi:hypothetical protein
MSTALVLLFVMGLFGAFDTLYYHEWKARLPARYKQAAPELKLHAMRDFLYALLFATLPWLECHGVWAAVLVIVMVAEIVITLWDFVIEVTVRKPMGDVVAGERVAHAGMGILYGAMIAYLVPTLWSWWAMPSSLIWSPAPVQDGLRWALTLMAAGVFASGLRDLYAAYGLPGGAWPWSLKKRGR